MPQRVTYANKYMQACFASALTGLGGGNFHDYADHDGDGSSHSGGDNDSDDIKMMKVLL